MSSPAYHADEIPISLDIVRVLLNEQFPKWSNLPLREFVSIGTDNRIFRLGDELCVRIPRTAAAAERIEAEARTLPLLIDLPIETPNLLALGSPSATFPFHWSILSWIDGEMVDLAASTDQLDHAFELAEFITALRALETDNVPLAGKRNNWRGAPLASRSNETYAAIGAMATLYDTARLKAAWSWILDLSPDALPGRWLHGDLLSSNLIVRNGRIVGVVDFGLAGVGDPACDLTIAWAEFDTTNRSAFRAAVNACDDEWHRARGCAFCWAVIALPYYAGRNLYLERTARRAIEAVLRELNF